MRNRLAVVGIIGLASLTGLACSDSKGGGGTGPSPTPGGDPPGIENDGFGKVPATAQSVLRKAQSCSDLIGMLQGDALRKMNDYVDAQVETYKRFGQQFNTLNSGTVASGANAGAPSGSPTPSLPGSGGAAGDSKGASGGAGQAATDYSQTNTQVKGVDEADIVKNDAKYIYLLHGKTFRVMSAFPATALAATSSVDLEGTPQEMFVADGKAVIFSTVDGAPIYAAAGITARNRYSDGSNYSSTCFNGYCSWWYQRPMTKVTVLAVAADGASASVAREMYFEGFYDSSRRVDTHVRAVLGGATFGPQVAYYPNFGVNGAKYPETAQEFITGYEAMRKSNTALIKATTVQDWLPYSFAKSGAVTTPALASCQDFFVPSEGSTSYGVTQIAAFDLDHLDADPRTTAIVGSADTVYSSTDALYVATRAWDSPKGAHDRPAGRKAPFVDFLPSTATHLHKFDLKTDPSAPHYVASGPVPGWLNNQFALDEQGGILRVATTERRGTRTWISDDEAVQPLQNSYPVNRVFAITTSGKDLRVVGDAGDIAPSEQIYSTRFVGGRGYVVTFRRVDPLFVIDLSKPEGKLPILGQLTIPGFSEYMHPLDDQHLLTIGRQTTDVGRAQNLQIQVFDVTDATKPKVMHSYAFDPTSYGYSEAEQNHKAFTYYESHKLLSFPYYGYSNTPGGTNSFRSSAELFKIDLALGIQKLGSVDHTSLFGQNWNGWCSGWFSPYVRRSVFLDNVLYSISYGGVIATDTTTMAKVAELPLTAPSVEGYAGCR